MKGEVKAQIGIDGGLLTIVFSVELAGGALLTYCLYQGMKKIGVPTNRYVHQGCPLEQESCPLLDSIKVVAPIANLVKIDHMVPFNSCRF